MRAFEGQMSERVAIRRTTSQKKLILQRLRDELKHLKPTVSPLIRESIRARIADLEAQLGGSGSDGVGYSRR